jgi:hypothetical protein
VRRGEKRRGEERRGEERRGEERRGEERRGEERRGEEKTKYLVNSKAAQALALFGNLPTPRTCMVIAPRGHHALDDDAQAKLPSACWQALTFKLRLYGGTDQFGLARGIRPTNAPTITAGPTRTRRSRCPVTELLECYLPVSAYQHKSRADEPELNPSKGVKHSS